MEVDVIRNTISESKIHFVLNVALWDCFDASIFDVLSNLDEWKEVKLLDENGNRNPALNSIPNDVGGIYLFIAKPNKVPETHLYLMYVGRARLTSAQNLRKRCIEYTNPNQHRPKIKRMIEHWGKYLYVRYLPLLCGNQYIDTIEAELINKILPPFNDEIPDSEIRNAIKAFSI